METISQTVRAHGAALWMRTSPYCCQSERRSNIWREASKQPPILVQTWYPARSPIAREWPLLAKVRVMLPSWQRHPSESEMPLAASLPI